MDTSSSEKADALIALSLIFGGRSANGTNPASSIEGMVAETLRAAGPRRIDELERRASFVGSLPEIERQRWLGRWVGEIRRRGRATRLDPHVNPEHIARVLRAESLPIRRCIVSYLPPDVVPELERHLGPVADAAGGDVSPDPPPEIIDVVKRRFLANFVQFESIGAPNAIDELSGEELYRFVLALGRREIAIACRGITSREKVAAFLCRFAEEDAKAIATNLSHLDDVEPIWVSVADRTVQRLWNRRLRPRQMLHSIGLELLACAFAERGDAAVRYTSQKLSVRDSARWKKRIDLWRERLNDPDADTVEVERRRAEIVVGLAGTLKETGSL